MRPPLRFTAATAALVLLVTACSADDAGDVVEPSVPTTTSDSPDDPLFTESDADDGSESGGVVPSTGDDAGEPTDGDDEPRSSDGPTTSRPEDGTAPATSGPGSVDPDSDTTASNPTNSTPASDQAPRPTTATTQPRPSNGDPALPGGVVIPVVQFDGDARDEPVPYFGDEPVGSYTPAAADAGFCTAIAIINSRPQPKDDFEDIVVADQYFRAVEPLVPDELEDDFAVIFDWIETVLDSGEFPNDPEDLGGFQELNAAVETINDFVDSRCLGF